VTTLEVLRNRLIDQILTKKNQKLLEAIHEIFNSTELKQEIELNSYQLEMIRMGLMDIERGNLISETNLGKKDSSWME
jgi:predicted transcriptional regulator